MANFIGNGGLELALGMIAFVYVAIRAFLEDTKHHKEMKLKN